MIKAKKIIVSLMLMVFLTAEIFPAITLANVHDGEDTFVKTYEFYESEDDSDPVNVQKIKDGESLVEVDIPKKNGFVFDGWFDEVNDKVEFNIPIEVTENGAVKAHAKFIEEYTVRFYNDKSTVVNVKKVPSGDKVSPYVLTADIDKEDKIFSHWSLSKGGEEPFDFDNTEINSHIKLHAVFKPAAKVTFDSNGGSYVNFKVVSIGDTVEKPEDPSRYGYTFSKWVKEDGTDFDFENDAITEKLKLNAIWTPKSGTNYTVVHLFENANDEEYTIFKTETKQGQTGDSIDPDSLTESGFTFDEDKTAEVNKSKVINGKGNTKYEMYYKRDAHTLKFKFPGKTLIFENVKHGATTDQYWDEAFEASGDKYDWKSSVTGYITPPPILMPNQDITFNSVRKGNIKGYVVFDEILDDGSISKLYEIETNRARGYFYGGRHVKGFTWDYVGEPGKKRYAFKRMPNGRIEVHTVYKRNAHNINLQMNNGDSNEVIENVKYDKHLTEEEKSKVFSYFKEGVSKNSRGETFKGWYTDSAYINKFDPDTFKMPDGNSIFYAKWEKIDHLIFFDDKSEDNSVLTIDAEDGEKLSDEDKAKLEEIEAGFDDDFLGWYIYQKDKNGNRILVEFDKDDYIYIESNIHAIFEPDVVRIKYLSNNSNMEEKIDEDIYLKDIGMTIKGNLFNGEDGKAFVGWEDEDGNRFLPNETVNSKDGRVFKALWVEETQSTFIKYNSNGGNEDELTFLGENNSTYNVLPNTTFTKDGYRLIGWARDKNAEAPELDFDATIVVDNNNNENNILYAVWEENNTEYSVHKNWRGGPFTKPVIAIQLYQNDDPYGDPIELKNGNYNYTWENLPKNDLDGYEYFYSVSEIGNLEHYDVYIDGTDIFNVFNTDSYDKLEIVGNKTWVNGPEDKPAVIIALKRNGEVIEEKVLENGETEYTFSNLDPVDYFGREYNYTIDELETPEHYIETVEGYNVTNAFDRDSFEKVNVKGILTWLGGPEEKPEVTIVLKRNGEVIEEKVLQNGETEYDFGEQYSVDKFGEEYTYTVDELEVPDHYTKTIEGYNITNIFDMDSFEKVTVKGHKTWVDGPLDKPLITVILKRNGKVIDEKVLENGETEYIFNDLSSVDQRGERYIYTVDEREILIDYDKKIDGYNLINTYNVLDPSHGEVCEDPITPLERPEDILPKTGEINDKDLMYVLAGISVALLIVGALLYRDPKKLKEDKKSK